jgi:hypothetical protein
MFDARSWLAEQLGFAREELELVSKPGPPVYRGGQVASYTRAGRHAAHILVGSPRKRRSLRFDSRYRLVTAVWSDGEASTRLAVDERISW